MNKKIFSMLSCIAVLACIAQVNAFQRTRSQRVLTRQLSKTSPSVRFTTIRPEKFFTTNCPSLQRQFATATTAVPTEDWRERIPWYFRKTEDRKKLLFKAFEQKIVNDGKTEILPSYDALEMAEALADEKIINAKDAEGNTPLIIAIKASSGKSTDFQKKLIETLKYHGAHLRDPRALSVAVKTNNIGALTVIQQHNTLKYVYTEFEKVTQEIKEVVEKIKQSPKLAFLYANALANLKRLLSVLDVPVRPELIRVPVFADDKERDIDFEVDTASALYMLGKEYSLDPKSLL